MLFEHINRSQFANSSLSTHLTNRQAFDSCRIDGIIVSSKTHKFQGGIFSVHGAVWLSLTVINPACKVSLVWRLHIYCEGTCDLAACFLLLSCFKPPLQWVQILKCPQHENMVLCALVRSNGRHQRDEICPARSAKWPLRSQLYPFVNTIVYIGVSEGQNRIFLKLNISNSWLHFFLCDLGVGAIIKGKHRQKCTTASVVLFWIMAVRETQAELEAAEIKWLILSILTRMDRIRNECIRGAAHGGCLVDKEREARLRWSLKKWADRCWGNVVKDDLNLVPTKKEETKDVVRWGLMIGCGFILK